MIFGAKNLERLSICIGKIQNHRKQNIKRQNNNQNSGKIKVMENENEKLDRKELMEKYSDYILSTGERPKNVYLFAKENNISEGDFYQYFSGFDAIEKAYLMYFFEQSQKLALQIEHYEELSPKEKLLNFYYLFFENLNMNRSLVLMILDQGIKSNIRRYCHLRTPHHELVQSLDIQLLDLFEKMQESLNKYKDRPIEEILWIHFMSIFKYWKADDSPGFEKTDVYIEKSLDTGFEIVDSTLLDKVFDLGKFLWKR